MSNEKTLMDFINELKTELNNIDKRRDSILIALSMAEEKCSIHTIEQNLIIECNQDFLGLSASDAAYNFLTEEQKPCSTSEIANAIFARGVKGKTSAKMATTGKALDRLITQNKIIKIGRGVWSIKAPSEHEQL